MKRSLLAALVAAIATFLLLAPSAGAAGTETVSLVRVETPTPASKDLLDSLGLDLAEAGGPRYREAVLWGADDAAKLTEAGFEYRTKIADLAANKRANDRRDRAYAARVERSAFPSGRTDYRTLAEINDEMKKLAEENPGLVRVFPLAEKSVQGREIFAMEIAQDVNASDGRPVFLNMGVHHAREWPSAEHALEWGYEMINGTKSKDARASRLTKDIRTIILPVVNPDGFDISRDFEGTEDPGGGAAEVFSFKRKNCNVTSDDAPESGSVSENECKAFPTLGTDPNRNYGGLWGGPGASAVPAEADYRGPGPFSEPETRNVRQLVSSRHVTTLITNHTYTGLVLRPPGVAAQGPSVDENRGYKALGDAMAAKNGYKSQLSFNLYDTTGTTEDWTYYATGGFGFTFEIGPDEFHPPYAEVVQEWEGTGVLGDDATEGGGNREAYYVAAESTANEARHSVIDGKAPAGTVLRLKKEFMTQTSPVVDETGAKGEVREFRDVLDTTMTVPASGAFEWDINPSTRPAVAPKAGRPPTGPPSKPKELTEKPVPPTETVEIPFEYKKDPGADDEVMTVEVTNPAPAEDYDIALFRGDAEGKKQGEPIAGSAQFVNNRETAVVRTPEEGNYVLEVTNFAATGISYTARVLFDGPTPPTEGKTETWTLTCERPDGTILAGQSVFIARGERKTLDPCNMARQTGGPGATPTNPGTGETPTACAAIAGFRSAGARGTSGGGLRLGFERSTSQPISADVFQVSRGSRILNERLVARFKGKTSSFTWSASRDRKGRRLSDGYYFVRYRAPVRAGSRSQVDSRRITLRRSNGKFSTRPSFFRRDSCGALRSFKLSRPVFGGRSKRYSLGVSYRLNSAQRVTVTVLRGSKVVRRFAAAQRQPGTTYRLRLPVKGTRRGDYKVRIVAGNVTSTLTARRL